VPKLLRVRRISGLLSACSATCFVAGRYLDKSHSHLPIAPGCDCTIASLPGGAHDALGRGRVARGAFAVLRLM
jgi:hypothetical protein